MGSKSWMVVEDRKTQAPEEAAPLGGGKRMRRMRQQAILQEGHIRREVLLLAPHNWWEELWLGHHRWEELLEHHRLEEHLLRERHRRWKVPQEQYWLSWPLVKCKSSGEAQSERRMKSLRRHCIGEHWCLRTGRK